jgi:hypothetical protein
MVLYGAAAANPWPELSEQMPPGSLSARLSRGNEEFVRAHFTKPRIHLSGSHRAAAAVSGTVEAVPTREIRIEGSAGW